MRRSSVPFRSSALGLAMGPGDPFRIGCTGPTGIDYLEVLGIQTRRNPKRLQKRGSRPEDAVGLWQGMENAGAAPCGLGARDVLRLEARLPLYGHELRDDITPLEAGLGMFVKFDTEDFVGRNALAAQKEEGIPRRLYGLEMIDAGVPREGYSVYAADRLGFVTSGGPSPVRDGFIALALLKRGAVSVDDEVDVEIRGKKKRAKVVKTPFYRRA